jgi:hypothetical protein
MRHEKIVILVSEKRATRGEGVPVRGDVVELGADVDSGRTKQKDTIKKVELRIDPSERGERNMAKVTRQRSEEISDCGRPPWTSYKCYAHF